MNDPFDQETIKMIEEKEREFAEGGVTCEFKTSGENLAEKMKWLQERSQLPHMYDSYSYWHVYYCAVCAEYSCNERPFHCSLEDSRANSKAFRNGQRNIIRMLDPDLQKAFQGLLRED